MTKTFVTGILVPAVLLITACDKEKIVTTTEYVHDEEYIELPPDTVLQVDTVATHDSILVHVTDTVVRYDTTVETVVDTVIQVIDVLDTVFLYDTVVSVEHHFDTITLVDTVLTAQCSPNEHLAFAALQYYCDPLVINLVNQEFGLTDGWIFYLSEFQSDWSASSPGVYHIYGFIDYWTPDWSAYYPLEYYWRLSHTAGDPADPENWQLTDPPSGAPAGRRPGLTVLENLTTARTPRR